MESNWVDVGLEEGLTSTVLVDEDNVLNDEMLWLADCLDSMQD